MLQDLPDHIARASIVKNYFSSEFFRHYLRITPFPVPYLLPDLFDALLLALFNPCTSAKLFSTFAAFTMVAGVFYFVHRVAPLRFELSLLAFALLFSNVFFKGNLGFYYSLGFLFWLLGFWWPVRWKLTLRQELLLAIAGIVLYGIHLVSLGIWLFIFSVSFIWHCGKKRAFEWKKLWPSLPPLLITIAFFLWNGSGAVSTTEVIKISGTMLLKFGNFADKYHALQLLFSLPAYNECLFIAGFTFYFIAAFFSLLKNKITEEWLIFFLLILGFLIAPAELPSLIRPGERIILIAFLWGLIVIKYPDQKLLRVTWIIIMLLICFTQGLRLQENLKKMSVYYEPYYEAIQAIPPKSLVCPVSTNNDVALEHFAKFSVAEQQSVTPSLFTCKHLCIRYRQPLPEPPVHACITKDMLNTYDYFISSGKFPQVDTLLFNKTLKIVWHKKWFALLKNESPH